MKRYTQEELNEILKKHQHWLNQDCDNWECMKADLSHIDLSHLDLRSTDLSYVDLSNANLNCTNLSNANLCGTDLYNTNLIDSNLNGAKNISFIPYACPDTGSFIGYKRAGICIVELKILSDARRCSATGRECRCDKAEVLSIQYPDKYIPCDIKSVASNYDRNFIYRVGEIVEEPHFDENRWNECTTGIHFFINRQEAVEF